MTDSAVKIHRSAIRITPLSVDSRQSAVGSVDLIGLAFRLRRRLSYCQQLTDDCRLPTEGRGLTTADYHRATTLLLPNGIDEIRREDCLPRPEWAQPYAGSMNFPWGSRDTIVIETASGSRPCFCPIPLPDPLRRIVAIARIEIFESAAGEIFKYGSCPWISSPELPHRASAQIALLFLDQRIIPPGILERLHRKQESVPDSPEIAGSSG